MSLHHMLRAAAGNAGPSDPYFEYNTLLLTGDGTNGAQNNTFLDSSTNNFTITRNGNATQGTFSPYGNLWSNYFDGNGDYLQAPSNAAFDFGTGNFTIEAWVNITGINSFVSIGIATRWSASSTNWLLRIIRSGSVYNSIVFNANDGEVSASYTFNQNTWYHVAAVRNGSSFRFYVNGVDIGGSTVSWNIAASSEPVRIGANGYSSFEYWWPGYISNLRIVKGTALYTSAFTPSTTPLTAVSGTSLLTCQSNRFKDNSSNNFAITRNGDVKVTKFSPFNPTAPYSAATIGGSGYFDGTGDYLTQANNTSLNFGTGDMTIECWAYLNTTAGTQTLAAKWQSGNTAWIWQFSSTTMTFYFAATSSSFSWTPSTGTWYHLAISRSGSSVRFFVNGVQTGSTSTNAGNADSTSIVAIGANNDGPQQYLNGYISNLRIVKGTAVYTSNFTPPTLAPLATSGSASAACYPSTTNVNTSFAASATSLLLNFTNAGIPDLSMQNDLETVGNAQVSTTVKKYGTGSLYFDGTGDWLTAISNPQLDFGSGDFTVEFWIYMDTVSGTQGIISKRASELNYAPFNVELTSSALKLYMSTSGSSWAVSGLSTASMSTGTWYHYAFVRSGTTIYAFLNGVSVGSTGTVSGALMSNTSPIYIGSNSGSPSGASPMNGYIDDLRITKGYARYTANFTPPTAALPVY